MSSFLQSAFKVDDLYTYEQSTLFDKSKYKLQLLKTQVCAVRHIGRIAVSFYNILMLMRF